MGNITTIKNKIIEVIEATNIFADIYGHPLDSIESSPIAVVRYTGNTNEFQTNRSNERTYNYEISILLPLELGSAELSVEAGVNEVENISDQLIDLFDNSQDLNGLALYVQPASGAIETAQINNGLNIIGTVTLAVRKTFDII